MAALTNISISQILESRRTLALISASFLFLFSLTFLLNYFPFSPLTSRLFLSLSSNTSSLPSITAAPNWSGLITPPGSHLIVNGPGLITPPPSSHPIVNGPGLITPPPSSYPIENGPDLIIPPPSSASGNGSDQDRKQGGSCDIYDGKWVYDVSYPIYAPGSCPFKDKFSCFEHGRSDLGYLSYRWQPHGCDIPRFDGKRMLEMLRGKRLVFVGDSLNRNMCLSLICSLSVYTKISKLEPKDLYSFSLKEYNCSITFIEAPFLVDREMQRGTLRLDKIQHKASEYQDADFLIFNTGRWWNLNKAKRGENFFQEGDVVHSKMDLGEAYEKALNTWAKWVDKNVNKHKTQVFFAGLSAAHFSGGQWNSGGNCDGETEPITDDKLLTRYPRMMRTLESVISKMSTPVVYLNITRMTGYRKDAHPSVYWQSKTDRRPGMHQDCTHWCLPGVPDSWNHLLFVSLLLPSKGSTRTH